MKKKLIGLAMLVTVFAMQVVGVGFIIGVLQDSTETALNSSTDILFTATADYAKRGYHENWN